MTKREVVTYELVSEFLSYDPETGILTWKPRDLKWFRDGDRKANAQAIWNAKYAGRPAGAIDGGSRLIVRIFKTTFFAHRLAFLLMAGRWPDGQIDHINGDATDNRWENLRECADYENKQNLGKRADSAHPYPGIEAIPSGRWTARIRKQGKRYFLGTFDTPEEAFSAYRAAKKEIHTFQPTPRGFK